MLSVPIIGARDITARMQIAVSNSKQHICNHENLFLPNKFVRQFFFILDRIEKNHFKLGHKQKNKNSHKHVCWQKTNIYPFFPWPWILGEDDQEKPEKKNWWQDPKGEVKDEEPSPKYCFNDS